MISHRLRRFGLAAVLCSVVTLTHAADVDLSTRSAAEVAREGRSLEQGRQWVRAIQLYESALKLWPEDADIKYALRRSRIHFGIDRRYADHSFEQKLRGQPTSRALALFDEVVTTVQEYYVDHRFRVTSYVAHGTESLYMALANRRFLDANIPHASSEQVKAVRRRLLKEYWNKSIPHRVAARETVREVCDIAQRELGLAPTTVVMEYVCGGCNALDDYSSFLTPDRLDELYGNIDGEFVGIGIEMEAEPGRGQHLVNVLEDSPAWRGGLEANDYIVEIDGQDCRDMTTDEAARLLKGVSGSEVALVLESPSAQRRDSRLVRKPVKVKSVTKVEMLDEERGVGYIRMTGFQKSTTSELDRALETLEGRGMKSLIWDLRGNPGGLLETAAGVLDRFIDGGVLVSTRGRTSDQNQVFSATGFHTHRIPMVLLVDGDSASASEIVAGAIQEHRRGTIVGRKTYGKWSVQSILPLRDGTGLRLTTARFFSPHGKNLAKVGVRPHINVDRGDEDDRRTTYFRGESLMDDPDIARGLEVLQTRETGHRLPPMRRR